MLKNYLKTAFRNLWRYKGFSLINIASLTIGVICCLAIGLFVWDERKYDAHIPDADNIFRLYDKRTENGVNTNGAVVPPMYATFLKQQYPEVDTTLRILMDSDKFLIEVGEKRDYEDKGWYVEPSFFQFFPISFAYGDPHSALTEPNTVVISQDMADRYFGNADPVGKTLKLDKKEITVKGVFKKLPEHFHLDFNYLISLPTAELDPERMQAWSWHQFYTYIKVKEGTDVVQLEKKFQKHMETTILPVEAQRNSTWMPYFQPLSDIHLRSADFIYDNAVRGNETYVKGLSVIALFILLIACFNFINLATARSFRRAKEIGVRKVVGAGRKQLVVQFIGETVLLSLISVVLAAIITFLLVPSLNEFTGKTIDFNPFTNGSLALLLIISGIIIGMLAGLYPALVLSGFQPIKVLKGNHSGTSNKNGWLRQSLVVVQFSLSALLIVCSLIVYRQVKFMNNKELGFNKEQIIYFQVRDSVAANVGIFKQELSRASGIKSITTGYGLPGDAYAGDGVFIPGKNEGKQFNSNVFIGDHDYTKTLGLELIAGRDFSKEITTDVEEAFLINEAAIQTFGFGSAENALGQPIHWEKWGGDSLNPLKKGKVIGVVKDFHYKSLHEKVTTSVIHIYPPVLFKMAVKLSTTDIKSTLAYINDTWNKFVPGYPLDYQFMDETYGKMYEKEEKLADLLFIFTVMAVVVGCMGLFALAAFSAEQRVKEIGIRKVLGASVFNLTALLSGSFVKLVLIAALIAFPIAWWTMNNWLEDFPYRITISPWIFIVAAVLSLLIALFTVSLQTVKAALANPVKNLRTE